jgi:dihydropteroate synthase
MNPSLPQASAWEERFAGRSTCWQLRTRRLELGRRPLLMGIVNVTPDSFSDGGQFVETRAAVDHALRLAAEGADILDIGGQSTRPYSQRLDAKTELGRVMPVLNELLQRVAVPLSIDTSSSEVATEAIRAGAEIVNDVTALKGDSQMLDVVRQARIGVCLMHMQGTPETMQDKPAYDDVVHEVSSYLQARRDHLIAEGIDRQRIALDPGIGFGKTHQHNLTLLANCFRLHALSCPVLVGHSRKGFIAKVAGDTSVERTAGTIGVALSLASQGVQILRVHEVAPVRQALQLYEATGGIDGQVLVLGQD